MERSLSRSMPLFPTGWLAALVLAILAAGCVGNSKLTDVEKARLIKEKRNEARDLLAKYRASDGDNLDALKRYVEVHRETTEIAPETCPKCWASFGEALSFMGYHYWNLYNDALDELDKAPPADQAKLKAEAASLKKQWVKFFKDSNKAYEFHFRSNDVTVIHPYSYERVMRHNELLGNYELAIYYLEKCLDNYPMVRALDEATRQRFEKLRRLYRNQRDLQKEREARGDAPKALPRPPSGRGLSPAQKKAAQEEEEK